MKNEITLEPIVNENGFTTQYNVYFGNSAFLGTFDMLEDGFYFWDPPNKGGYFSDYDLDMISSKLKEVNNPWRDKINNYFDSIEHTPESYNTKNEFDPDDLPF